MSRARPAGASPCLTLAGELRRAISSRQLRLYYQPVIGCASGHIGRVEALVRWQHPTRGLLVPDYFIPLAEQTGAIDALTAWVLDEALQQCRSWQDEGLALGVAVNISLHTLQDAQFPDVVSALLRAYEIPATRLTEAWS